MKTLKFNRMMGHETLSHFRLDIADIVEMLIEQGAAIRSYRIGKHTARIVWGY